MVFLMNELRIGVVFGGQVVSIGGTGTAADLKLFWGKLPERWEVVKLQDDGQLAH
jgi:hypothetical protein